MSSLYETDYYRWALQQAERLRKVKPDWCDWQWLAEEARSVAASQMGLGREQYEHLFPPDCPWTLDEILTEDFLPVLSPNANGRS